MYDKPADFVHLAACGAEVGVAPGVHRKHGQDPLAGVGDDVIRIGARVPQPQRVEAKGCAVFEDDVHVRVVGGSLEHGELVGFRVQRGHDGGGVDHRAGDDGSACLSESHVAFWRGRSRATRRGPPTSVGARGRVGGDVGVYEGHLGDAERDNPSWDVRLLNGGHGLQVFAGRLFAFPVSRDFWRCQEVLPPGWLAAPLSNSMNTTAYLYVPPLLAAPRGDPFQVT